VKIYTDKRLYHGYKFSRGYKKLTIWSFSKLTYMRVGVMVEVPDKGLSHQERYTELCKTVVKQFGFCTCYDPKK